MRSLLASLLVLLVSCQSAPPSKPASPYALILGTAQDAGLPQVACACANCTRARRDPQRARYTSCLLLVDPRSGERWLFDATPDLPEQVELARGHGGPAADAPGRPALFEGVFLTHAHIGHYTGLMYLGREAYGSEVMPVHLTSRFAEFLEGNGPWDQLLAQERIALRTFGIGVPIVLAEDLSVTALAVPHRDEYSDTVAYRIDGPARSLLFLPDIDKWDAWEHDIEALLHEVDFALIDGTFYSGAEIPGRDMSEVPHPFITESIERFAGLPENVRGRIIFTHLNHSNPVADPGSQATRTVRAAGMHIARRGQRFEL